MTFKDLINADIKCAKIFVNGQDPADINIAAYHTQQALEKTCAYICQQRGVKTIRTHKIMPWLEHLQDNGVEIPKLLEEMADEITSWEDKSRYNLNFVAARREINSVLEAIEELLSRPYSVKKEGRGFIAE